ncbi:MAG: hypothetical protein COA42_11910 [Alteromonadaceae bacterium]|nr:MAG: hypothetical protein COA42_11910 [Alteromonadaceae bacterium]
MTNITSNLRHQNAAILIMLNKVNALGNTTNEGLATLFEAKDMLLSHITKENNILHPALKQAAKSDAHIDKAVSYFLEEIEKTSTIAINFFEKYPKGGKGLSFASDFGRLHAALLQRVRMEEHALYTIYEELQVKKVS